MFLKQEGVVVLKTLKHLLDKNLEWAKEINEKDPEFFKQLSKQQNPEYLWIGCSDSRVPANQIVDLAPGDVFVHRNIANIVVHTDLNCLSVIQYAVDILKVKHIIVCGHYGCGGIKAAMDDEEHGLIDNWLRHIQDIHRLHAGKMQGLDHEEQVKLMCNLNIIEQVKNICDSTIVQNAWKNGAELSVHGWVYSLENGVLKDLGCCVSAIDEVEEKYREALSEIV